MYTLLLVSECITWTGYFLHLLCALERRYSAVTCYIRQCRTAMRLLSMGYISWCCFWEILFSMCRSKILKYVKMAPRIFEEDST